MRTLQTVFLVPALVCGVAAVAQADCIQKTYQLSRPAGAIVVTAYNYDDILQIRVNGQKHVDLRLNVNPQNPVETIDVGKFFLKQRVNTVTVRGYNRAYTGHDANPGHIRYTLTGLDHVYGCSQADYRVPNNDYLLIDHQYSYIDTSILSPLKNQVQSSVR